MKAKYTSPRRTEIIAAAGEFRMEDVIPNEGCVITVSHHGFIKRTPVADYRSQKRGGKGVIGAETYEEDFVEHLFTASTHDYILFFTSIRPVPCEEGLRRARGHPRLEGQVGLVVPAAGRGREDRGHALREGFRGGPLPRHGDEERRHEEDQPVGLHQRHPRGRAASGSSSSEGDALVGCVLTTGQQRDHPRLATRARPCGSANATGKRR